MTLTFIFDLDSVKMSQQAKYFSQISFNWNIIVWVQSQTNTHQLNCSTYTTLVIIIISNRTKEKPVKC